MKPFLFLLLSLCVAGCERLTPNGQTPDAVPAEEGTTVEFDQPDVNMANSMADAPMAWTYRPSQTNAIAIYGASQQEAQLALRCERDVRQIRFSRAVPPPPPAETMLTIRAGGGETSYPAKPVPNTTLSRIEARVSLDDPTLDLMASPASHFTIRVADGEELEIPGGPTIQRLVQACRGPIIKPLDGAFFQGSIPCADCPGIDVTLSFAGPPGMERYRLVYNYRERAVTSWEGSVSTQAGESGPVYRLTPDIGSETIWLEWLTNDTLAYRTPDNQPSEELRRYPLRLSEERSP